MTYTIDKNKIIAIILCFTMLFSITSGIFSEAFAAEEEIVEENVYDVTDGGRISLPHNQKVTLSVDEADSYQWQTYVYVGETGLWVNIHDANSQTLDISYAMLANTLTDRNTSLLRCKTADEVYTGEVTVFIDFTEESTVEVLEPLQTLPEMEEDATQTPDENVNGEDDTTQTPDENVNGEEDTTQTPDTNTNGEEDTTQTPDENTNGEEDATQTPDENTNGEDETNQTPDTNTNGGDAATQTPDTNTNVSGTDIADVITGNGQQDASFGVENGATVITTAGVFNELQQVKEQQSADASASSTVPAATTPSVTPQQTIKTPVVSSPAPIVSSEAAVTKAPVALTPQTSTTQADAPLTLTSTEPETDITEQESKSTSPAAATFTATREADVPTGKYMVVINYVFADGDQAASPWTATIAAGSSYSETIASPDVLGYTPDKSTVEINIEASDSVAGGTMTETVTYSPAQVKYEVHHYLQNVSDDKYAAPIVEEKTGYTESEVGSDLAKDAEDKGFEDLVGFYPLLYDTTITIAADGSTVVEIYYDRYYYLMSFDLDGGYGVEPIYAKYGAQIANPFPAPEKAGYDFLGWTVEGKEGYVNPPTTMPAFNSSYTANWKAADTTYDVVYWYENADDRGYSQAGTRLNYPGTSGEKVNLSSHINYVFDGRDDEHFTYSHADSNVTIKGDGSTVVNVYFTRKTYTLTFVGDVLTCEKTEHEHTEECCSKTGNHDYHWCNHDKCSLEEHTHGNSCYSEQTILTITEKYDADITSTWTTDPIKSMLDDGYVFQSSVTSKYYSFLEKMPGQDITMTATLWSGSTYTWYYYLEVLEGQDTTGLTTRTDNGKTYYQYDSTTVKGTGLSLTYDEDYYPITGFTQRDNVVPAFNNRTAYLYYVRNSYDLTFSNHGTVVNGKGGEFLYQADISGQNFTPAYPSTLEPNAYVFEGWYTSPFFGDTKFNFTTTVDGETVNATMPANDLTLYARWVPINHNVKLFPTQADMDAATNQIGTTEVVAHGGTATEPADPTRGKYIFVGWFYMDGTTEKAFDFSMPVNQDLDLYAKWSSNKLMPYTIKYAVENKDGSLTYIAEDTTGSGLAGTTKTFEAKAGDELYAGYQSGYFPNTNSHSLTIDIENEANNEFTFVYTKKPNVDYTVRYLIQNPDGTTEPAIKNADGTEYFYEGSTPNAVITETFKLITGYMPDAYQKRLVLSADESQNVIIFWYVADPNHAPVQIVHYIQNAEGNEYTIYQESTDLNGEIGKVYDTNVLNITGYNYDHATANGSSVTAADSKVSGTVAANGLLLELYYNRELHPYEFKFLEQGTNKVLADSVTGTARYGSQVVQNAKAIDDYTLVSEDAQAINIQIEDGDTASKNVRIFYYVEKEVTINYIAVGPAGSGTVSPASETVKVRNEVASGSTATANIDGGYRFAGWYDNANCTGTPISTEAHFIPEKENGKNVAATYYAKFEEDEVTINYVAVGGGGNVNPASETVNTITGTAAGSTATVNDIDNYRFIGWFTDEACTQPVDASLVDANNKFVPAKVDGKNVAATYYAKFEPLMHIKIHKDVDTAYDDNTTFVFKVTGQSNGIVVDVVVKAGETVEIKSLPQDIYTVTEVNSGWRYNNAGSKEISATGTVNFTNTTKNPHWLGWTETVSNFFENFK